MPLKTKITKKQANLLFVIQCLNDIDAVVPTTDTYDNIVYPMDAKLVKGSPIVFGKDNQYKIEQGDSFEWQISKALYNTIFDMGFKGKAKLGVKMSVTADSTAWVVSNPEDAVFDDIRDNTNETHVDEKLEYGYRNVKSRDDQRDLNIKWGMSLNNAVKVVTEFGKPNELILADPDKLKGQIKEMTFAIMDVATSLDDWIAEQGEESRMEQAVKDEDLPF